MRTTTTLLHTTKATNGAVERRSNAIATAGARRPVQSGTRATGWPALRSHWILKEGKLLLVWTRDQESDAVPLPRRRRCNAPFTRIRTEYRRDFPLVGLRAHRRRILS
jgi:hypothetical protein